MIKYDEIKTQKGLFANPTDENAGDWKVMANVGVRSECMVSKADFEESPTILDSAAERCRLDAWHHIYGDLSEQIKELERYAIKNALLGEEKVVSDLCETINKLLRLP